MRAVHPFDDDKLHEECGVFGIAGHADAAAHTALGLHALQHRGQQSAGIVSSDGEQFYSLRGPGQVSETFGNEEAIDRLQGAIAIGHNRYSTTGAPVARNIQPLFADFAFGGVAVAHNGNLTNALSIRRRLAGMGALFQSTTDTEVIIHLIARSRKGKLADRLVEALGEIEGAYSLVAISRSKLFGVRDPHGVRPLVLGQLGKSWILTSETCALDIIGAGYVRDVEPGEMVVVDGGRIESHFPFDPIRPRPCIFELIYFARPDSAVFCRSVYEARMEIGRELAREAPAPADVVVPVPDSGVPAGLGYAQQADLPFSLGIIRNHYVGRTFIEPTQQIRHLGVRLKHNANTAVLAGKRVVLVDDSIVRGTTSTKIVEMVRNAGAAEVHMRISSPPTTHSCFYGIDTPHRDTLLAARFDLERMRREIGVDSLAFVSLDGLYRALGETGGRGRAPAFCDACFTGDYPIDLLDRRDGSAAGRMSLLDELA
ncbi:MAG: amidophosphoribosyltransferase [Alphaproteobacteria bacterium]|nr:amidophosphoribosyltransferase [Alphaproteobacteria bacterium]